jgi:hypothetical protein
MNLRCALPVSGSLTIVLAYGPILQRGDLETKACHLRSIETIELENIECF